MMVDQMKGYGNGRGDGCRTFGYNEFFRVIHCGEIGRLTITKIIIESHHKKKWSILFCSIRYRANGKLCSVK